MIYDTGLLHITYVYFWYWVSPGSRENRIVAIEAITVSLTDPAGSDLFEPVVRSLFPDTIASFLQPADSISWKVVELGHVGLYVQKRCLV